MQTESEGLRLCNPGPHTPIEIPPPFPTHAFPSAVEMRPRYKASLPEKLAQHGPAFRLADVMLDSFQLQVGHGQLARGRWEAGGPGRQADRVLGGRELPVCGMGCVGRSAEQQQQQRTAQGSRVGGQATMRRGPHNLFHSNMNLDRAASGMHSFL